MQEPEPVDRAMLQAPVDGDGGVVVLLPCADAPSVRKANEVELPGERAVEVLRAVWV